MQSETQATTQPQQVEFEGDIYNINTDGTITTIDGVLVPSMFHERITQDGKVVQSTESEKNAETQDFSHIQPVGKGFFGNIYDQFKGKAKEAVAFLMQKKEGEAIGALHHNDIGDIDLVWGNEKAGLQKISEKHPEILNNLQERLSQAKIVSKTDNKIKLESENDFFVVSPHYFGEEKRWLITAYEKKENTTSASSMNNETESAKTDNRIDTAPPKDGVSTANVQNNSDLENQQPAKQQKTTVEQRKEALTQFNTTYENYLSKEKNLSRADYDALPLAERLKLDDEFKQTKEYKETQKAIDDLDHKITQAKIWANGVVQGQINNGRITATEAKRKLEEVGVDVPKDILDKAEVEQKETVAETKVEEVKSPEIVVENEDGTTTVSSAPSIEVTTINPDSENQSTQQSENPALSSVEETTKALDDITKDDGSANNKALSLTPNKYFGSKNSGRFGNASIADAYHDAKKDGSNPELVKAVEELLADNSPQFQKDSKPNTKTDGKKKPIERFKKLTEKQFNKLAKRLQKAFKDTKINFFDETELGKILGEDWNKVIFQQKWKAINDKFNAELDRLINGTLPKGHIFQLGNPTQILQSAGIPDLPIELSATILNQKANETPHHPFNLSEVKNLATAIQNPLAIFSYGDKSKAVNIITEIESNGKKFLVGISLNPEIGGQKLEINSVRTVFPKDTSEWVNWVNDDKGAYFNKEKTLDFLNQQLDNPADLDLQERLKSATNIIQNFENPKVDETQFHIRYDKSGNSIGDGSWHVEPFIFTFDDFAQVKSEVIYSNSTETSYVKYSNIDNGRTITVRFSNHENNAVKFGDQLDGNFASKNEILAHLGLKKRTFIPDTYLSAPIRQIKKNDVKNYEEADITVQELYALGKNADISKYNGKVLKNSNWLVLGDAIPEVEKTTQNAFGQSVTVGKYQYEDIKFLKDKNETVYGFVKDGEVYINKNELNANTLFHEMGGHLWANLLKARFPVAHKNIIDSIIANKELMDKMRKNPNYSHLKTDEQIADEILATAIGNVGEQKYWAELEKEAGKTFVEKLKDYVSKAVNAIRRALGQDNENISKWTNEDFIKNATLEDIADAVTSDMLSGKKMFDDKKTTTKNTNGKVQFMTLPNGQKVKVQTINAEVKGLPLFQKIKNQQKELGIQFSMLEKSDFNEDGTVKESVLKEIAEEKAKIVKEAKANGTYMKAPNGKKSNLNEEQWVAVRTERFKKWFGDWENSNIITLAENAWNNKDFKDKVSFGISDKLSNKLNNLLGYNINQIVLTADAIRHIKNNHGQNEAQRGQVDLTPNDIAILPYVLNNFDTVELSPKYNDNLGNRGVTITKRINGISIVATIEKGKDKQFVVTSWQTKKSGASMQNAQKPNAQNDPDLAKIKQEIEKIKSAKENASKVTDKNGEPLVVYHISPNKGITEFKGYVTYFSTDLDYAKSIKGFDNVYETFLNVKNPYEAPSEMADVPKDVHLSDEATNPRYIKESSSDKHDAVIGKDSGQKGGKTIAVFNPNQIKSATDNVGTFSNESNDIRFQIDEKDSKSEKYEKIKEFIAERKKELESEGDTLTLEELLEEAKEYENYEENEKLITDVWNEIEAESKGNYSEKDDTKLDKGGIDVVYLQNVQKQAKNIEDGKEIFQRFSQEEQRGFTAGGTTNVEASIITGRKVGTNENQDDRNDRQESDVETYAKEVGIWHDNTEEYLSKKYGEPLDAGQESIVYDNGDTVVKTSNTFQYRDLQDALDSITLHNTYFPESTIKVIGFGKDSEGDFQIITEQPFIQGTHNITQEQIDEFVKKLGFDKSNKYGIDGRYKSDQTLLNDLKPKNVILTPQGNIIPIDTIMHLNTADWNEGGKREIKEDNSTQGNVQNSDNGNTPPPNTPDTQDSKNPNGTGVKALETRAFLSENLPKNVKLILEKGGFNYQIENQIEAEQQAKNLIDMYGIDYMYQAVKGGIIQGGQCQSRIGILF